MIVGVEREKGESPDGNSPDGQGFYEAVVSLGPPPEDEGGLVRSRIIEMASRRPDDVRLLVQVAGMAAKRPPESRAKDLAMRMKAAMDMIGDQILPPEEFG